MPPVIAVRPSVLLTIVDHVTRIDLKSPKQGGAPGAPAVSDPTPTFLPIAGLLMGETVPLGSVHISTCSTEGSIPGLTTTLSASFELPVGFRPTDNVGADVSPSQDAGILQCLLSESTDWQAAQKHCEQLRAVMPDMGVVGCYVVCSGSRQTATQLQNGLSDAGVTQRCSGGAVKKAKGEAMLSSDGIAIIANCVRQQLCNSALLSSTAQGFILLVVYDGEVTRTVCGTNNLTADSQHSSSAQRLPFDSLYVPVTSLDNIQGTAGVTVCPTDMEWIALANETVTQAHEMATPTTRCAVVRPNFFQRLCSAAHLTSPASSTAPRELEKTQHTSVVSSQNRRAGEELVESLRIIKRLFSETAASMPTTAAMVPSDVELLRSVATCLRGVPNKHPIHAHATQATRPEPSTEEMLITVLTLEVQCALHLRTLSRSQKKLIGGCGAAVTTCPPKAHSSKAKHVSPCTEGGGQFANGNYRGTSKPEERFGDARRSS